jgi:hypothetical protein
MNKILILLQSLAERIAAGEAIEQFAGVMP